MHTVHTVELFVGLDEDFLILHEFKNPFKS